MPGPLREAHNIVIKGPAAAGAYKPPKSLPKKLSYKHL
jgi:hypothetical protein